MASKVILEARAREFAAEPVGRHSTRPPMTWRRGIDKQSVQQSQSLPPLPAFKFIGTLSAARACAVLATKRLLPRQATWAVADAEGHDVLVHDEVQRFRGCGIYQNKPNCVQASPANTPGASVTAGARSPLNTRPSTVTDSL